MRHNEILQNLRALKPAFKDLRIRRAALFGSHARETADPTSDVDLLVEFEDDVDFFTFLERKEQLENKLKVSIDMIPFSALNKTRHQKILEEAIDV